MGCMEELSNPVPTEEETDIAIAPETQSSTSLSMLGSQGTREFIRYFLASAIALLVDVGSLFFFTSVVGIPYLYGGATAFILGLIVVYVLSVTWVFDHRSLRSPAMEFLLFSVVGVAGLFINELVLYLFTGVVGLYYLFSKAASVIVVFSWNFAARKYLLFRKEAEHEAR